MRPAFAMGTFLLGASGLVCQHGLSSDDGRLVGRARVSWQQLIARESALRRAKLRASQPQLDVFATQTKRASMILVDMSA